MQFIIIAHDHPDAAERRQESRNAHLALIETMKAEGKVLFAAAILNDAQQMAGSMLVCEFADEESIKGYFAVEPYVLNRVWGDVKATACKVAPTFAAK
jgi:uncharacterized protein